MSFNNLSFNISKSTATTSTSNENSITTSTSTAPATLSSNANANNVNQPQIKLVPGSNSVNSPFIDMLSGKVSPKLRGAEPVVTINKDVNGAKSEEIDPKKDLIELFDKYEIGDESKNDDEDEEDEIEAKFNRFKAERDRRESEAETLNEKMVVMDEGDQEAKEAKEINEVNEEKDKSGTDQVTKSLKGILTEEEPETKGPSNNMDEELWNKPKKTDQEEVLKQDINQDDGANQSIDEIEEDEQSAVEQYQLTEDEIKSNSQKLEIRSSSEKPEIRSRSMSQVNIDPSEQYQQSHKPFNFHNFLNHLKKKSADPIARYIRSFLIAFNKQSPNLTLQQKVKIVHDFKIFMNEKFQLFEPFKSMEDVDLENSREGLEKLIMNRIYIHCFPPDIIKSSNLTLNRVMDNNSLVTNDLHDDELFNKQLEKFSWINGHHLDVDLDKLSNIKTKQEHELNFMEYAIKELKKINTYRAPRDKIICILNSCKIIFGFLKVNKQETNADAFMPILIIIIIKAKIENLISNIHYIENFRGQEWLSHGETSYYLSSLQGAVNFIEHIEINDLTISQEEFDAHLEAWEANEVTNKQLNNSKPTPISLSPLAPPQKSLLQQQSQTQNQAMSPSQVLFTSAEMVTKSISKFLSPSPQDSPSPIESQQNEHEQLIQKQKNEIELQKKEVEEQKQQQHLINKTFKQLQEIIPNLDHSIMRDIISMNKGDMDLSLDACLQLVSD